MQINRTFNIQIDKMKLRILLLFVPLIACKPGAPSENVVTEISEVKADIQTSDTLAMQHTVKEFLSWYKSNYTQANSFGFTYQDKQGNYHVSIAQGEEYLKYLKSSGYISDKYVEDWLKYFIDKAAYLEENLQNEGPPEGFEFDLVLITQEPELVLNEVNNLQFAVTENNGEKAILQVAGDFGYDFEMVKENGNWKIAYIATMNYD